MIVQDGKYYLYRHIRVDKNEPFYIGIGTKNNRTSFTDIYNRAFSKFGRNRIWNGIAKRTSWTVEFILETNDYIFLEDKESEFINLYGRIIYDNNGILANYETHSRGKTHHKLSKDTIDRIKISNQGQKRSEEAKAKIKEQRQHQNMSHKWISIHQCDLEGNFIQEFPSFRHAKEFLGHKNDANLVSCCKGTRRVCGGFTWKYKELDQK